MATSRVDMQMYEQLEHQGPRQPARPLAGAWRSLTDQEFSSGWIWGRTKSLGTGDGCADRGLRAETLGQWGAISTF